MAECIDLLLSLPIRDDDPPSTAEQDGPHRLAYSPADAARVVGISRARLYDELNAGRLRAVKLGKRTLVPAASLRAWLESLPEVGR